MSDRPNGTIFVGLGASPDTAAEHAVTAFNTWFAGQRVWYADGGTPAHTFTSTEAYHNGEWVYTLFVFGPNVTHVPSMGLK